MKIITIATMIVCFLLMSATVFSECSESFSWLPNSEADLEKYIILHGQVDGIYHYETDVGNPELDEKGRCNGTVINLVCGNKYYFVAIAVNTAGDRSAYSDQAVVARAGAPSAPQDFKVE
ncbi:MAG: hypothetical protein DRI84_05540 [Bacteroidetes bacterium]|nr:MAG: hypothetical protein DRI84_05540 [Bacteroidota bacterium]